jgi:hypothetical protein
LESIREFEMKRDATRRRAVGHFLGLGRRATHGLQPGFGEDHALVDLSEAERCLEATYSRLGRPSHRAAVMLRIMLLQHLYGLSDPQAEEQLADCFVSHRAFSI